MVSDKIQLKDIIIMKKGTGSAYKIVNSHEELVKLLKHAMKRNIVSIENVECSFELNLSKLLIDAKISKIAEKQDTLTFPQPLLLSNVKCKTLVVESICLDDSSFLLIQESHVDSLRICSCKFKSFEIENSVIPDLTIEDSVIHDNVILDFSCVPLTSPIKINFDDTIFDGNLNICNLVLKDKESEFIMSGNKSRIRGDMLLYNLAVIWGNIDLSCDFMHDCIFRKLNSSLEENDGKTMLNAGTIIFNGGRIKNDLVFEYCHIHNLSISNTQIGGTREFIFSFNQMQADAATIFRDCALKRNSILLADKYTAEIFDSHLKENAVTTYRKWSNLFKKRDKRKTLRHLYYTLMWEPIALLIPSLVSSEGILLWLNKYSNNFNRSWIRGVFFTMIISLLSYYLLNYVGMEQPYFIFDIHFNGFGEVIKGYLSLLDIFNMTKLSDNVDFGLTPLGYIILFGSKIFISYGIWQTIYAFFKYRK